MDGSRNAGHVAAMLAAVLVVSASPPASANAPAPVSDATLAGDTLRFCGDEAPDCEPPETPHELHIVDEHLRFTIEGAEAGHRDHRVTVTATYRIRNDESRTIEGRTQFVAAGAVEREPHRVEFDGEPVDATLERVPVPADWRAPTRTTLPNGEEIELSPEIWGPTGGTEADTLEFELAIPPGEHRLRVEYEVWPHHNRAPRRYLDEPHEYVAVPYVLAPAETWASFGDLTVEVRLPPGYALSSSLPLEAEGRRHVGTFESLPADNLTLAAQPDPTPARAWLAHRLGYWAFAWLLPLVFVLSYGTVDLVRWTQRRLGRDPEASPGLLSGGIYLLAGPALGVAWLVGCFAVERLLCPYLVVSNYGAALPAVLATPLVVVLCWMVMAYRA